LSASSKERTKGGQILMSEKKNNNFVMGRSRFAQLTMYEQALEIYLYEYAIEHIQSTDAITRLGNEYSSYANQAVQVFDRVLKMRANGLVEGFVEILWCQGSFRILISVHQFRCR
jgi:hypothetical protein